MAMNVWRKPTDASQPDRSSTTKTAIVAAGAFLLAALPALAWYGHGWWLSRADSPLAPHVFFSLHDSTRVLHLPAPAALLCRFLSQAARRSNRAGADSARVWPDVVGPANAGHASLPGLAADLRFAGRVAAAEVLQDELLRPGDPAPLGIAGRARMAAIPKCLPTIAARRGRGSSVWAACFRCGMRTFRPLSLRPKIAPCCRPPRRFTRRSTLAEPIVAVHGSNFDLLYYCDHPGWAVPVDDAKFAEHVADATRARGHSGW